MREANFAHVRMLLIDNYDSFTYNLVQAFAAHGADVSVYRNDAISVAEGLALAPTHLVISPGPGRPEDAGVSLAMIEAFAGRVPILGVCLGHQCIVQQQGGEIVRAARLMHGKTSSVRHDGRTVFEGLPQPFEVGRYHSLCARTRVAARHARSHRTNRARRDHGRPEQKAADRGRAVSSGKRADPGRR